MPLKRRFAYANWLRELIWRFSKGRALERPPLLAFDLINLLV